LPSTTDKSTDIKHLFEYGRKLLMKMGLSQSDVKDIDDSELISLFEGMLSRIENIKTSLLFLNLAEIIAQRGANTNAEIVFPPIMIPVCVAVNPNSLR
jgi:hypothetical protein